MSLRSAIVSQFKKPRGILGRIVGWILAGRGSNLLRNRWTVDLIDPMSGDKVLEIGCGPGVGLELCLKRASVTAVGVDHSDVMIAQARSRNRKAVTAGRLRLIEGALEDVPPNAGPFDNVFSINLILFIDDKAAFAARVKSLMKPAGLFATTYQPRQAKATRADALNAAAELAQVLARAGFTDLRTEELDLKPAPAVCVLAKAP